VTPVDIIKPTPEQVQWQDMEFCVFVHFSINTFNNREWSDGTFSPKTFNPKHLDCEQWVKVAQAAGAKYMILVCKHHDGFCLWQTDTTDYSVKSSPYKNGAGDVVAEFVAACRKFGMRFGFYLSPWDRHAPEYADKLAYDQYYAAQLAELLSRYADYNEVFELWFDGAGSEGRVYDWDMFLGVINQYQPGAVRFQSAYPTIRWVGNEKGYTPYPNWNLISQDGTEIWAPAECDVPIHLYHWFHHTGLWGIAYRITLQSTKKLVDLYEKSVGHGANLLLNIAPTTDGLFSKRDIKRVLALGAEIRRRYDTPLAETAGSGITLELPLPTPMSVNCVVLQEDITEGERVRKYSIEVKSGVNWVRVQTSEQTISIGHKKIDKFAIPITTPALRLVVAEATAEPIIRSFRAYQI